MKNVFWKLLHYFPYVTVPVTLLGAVFVILSVVRYRKLHAQPPTASAPVVSAPAPAASSAETGCRPWDDNWQDSCMPKLRGHATEHADPIEHELQRYGTVFDPIDGRVKNIKLAASQIDGYTIQPGAVFSFNDVVGIRTTKRGYVTAPVLLQGRRTDDLGGGVCQVSSTLHAAAVEAGLVIVERLPHSLVPKYIDPGYDATVAFPASCEIKDGPCRKLDLKIKNPFDHPVTIKAIVTDQVSVQGEPELKSHLNILLLGADPHFKVEIKRQTEAMGRGGRRWVRSGKILSPDYVKVVQRADKGYFVRCAAIYVENDRVAKEYRWFSRYPPVDEVWEVGWARPADAGDPW